MQTIQKLYLEELRKKVIIHLHNEQILLVYILKKRKVEFMYIIFIRKILIVRIEN